MPAANPSSKSDKNRPTTGRGHSKFASINQFLLTNLTQRGVRVPTLPFVRMKECVLGKRYLLSLVVADDAYTQSLNRRYRKKHYVPNVLSFPIDKQIGEIVLNLGQAKKECATRGESFRFFVAILFVHSLLHLKGRRHGSIMEDEERTVLSKFHIANTFRSRKGK